MSRASKASTLLCHERVRQVHYYVNAYFVCKRLNTDLAVETSLFYNMRS